MCGGDNFGGQVKPVAPSLISLIRIRERELHTPFTEVFDTFSGKDVVIPLPRELSLDEALGGQALHRLDDLQIGYVEFFMLRRVIVLLGNKDTLCQSTVSVQSVLTVAQYAEDTHL
jgi:hypothetical protein